MKAVPAPTPSLRESEAAATAAAEAANLGFKIPSILFEGDEPAWEPVQGLGLKYALSAEPGLQTAPEQAALPETYGTGRLWLVARDPHGLYARWDLRPDQLAELNGPSAPSRLVLRIHVGTAHGPGGPEIPIPPKSQSAFIEVAVAGGSYVAELGYYAEGGWKELAVSEVVQTPREAFSAERAAQFATFPIEIPLARAQMAAKPLATPEPVRPAQALEAAAQASIPAPPSDLSRPNLIPRVPPGFPLNVVDFNSPSLPAEVVSQPPSSHLPRSAHFSVREGVWTPAQEAALADLIGWIPKEQPPGSAEFIMDVPPGQGALGISSAPLPVRLPGFPETPLGISSPAGNDIPQPKGFWFNVNAELVVYGSTEPGARVTIGGREIRLLEDGTFSYRFSLPDGRFQMPIAAASPHGDVRQANLEFERATNYQGDVGVHGQDPSLTKPGPESVG